MEGARGMLLYSLEYPRFCDTAMNIFIQVYMYIGTSRFMLQIWQNKPNIPISYSSPWRNKAQKCRNPSTRCLYVSLPLPGSYPSLSLARGKTTPPLLSPCSAPTNGQAVAPLRRPCPALRPPPRWLEARWAEQPRSILQCMKFELLKISFSYFLIVFL